MSKPGKRFRTAAEAIKAEKLYAIEEAVKLVKSGATTKFDETVEIARSLTGRTTLYVHDKNKGYGGNQKTCYRLALEAGADIVIMVHPDYQYTPQLIPAMASMIGNGLYSCVLGSRILGGRAHLLSQLDLSILGHPERDQRLSSSSKASR